MHTSVRSISLPYKSFLQEEPLNVRQIPTGALCNCKYDYQTTSTTSAPFPSRLVTWTGSKSNGLKPSKAKETCSCPEKIQQSAVLFRKNINELKYSILCPHLSLSRKETFPFIPSVIPLTKKSLNFEYSFARIWFLCDVFCWSILGHLHYPQ